MAGGNLAGGLARQASYVFNGLGEATRLARVRTSFVLAGKYVRRDKVPQGLYGSRDVIHGHQA